MHRDPTHIPPPDLHHDIARRLRRVCPDWPAERFEVLLAEVVRIILKYDYGRDNAGRAGGQPDREPGDKSCA